MVKWGVLTRGFDSVRENLPVYQLLSGVGEFVRGSGLSFED